MTTSYSITGMTCDNCVRHVSEALRELPGVTDVAVDLAAARADVTSDAPVPREAVGGALDDAGYALA